MIEIAHLSKRFRGEIALENVSLNCEPGHIIGLIGPNGCGKSTLLKHIVGILEPSAGSVHTFGTPSINLEPHDLAKIGYVSQEAELLNWMPANELLRYVEAHYETWNRELEDNLIQMFQINREQKIAAMSPGQRQKLSLVIAIAFEPEILILDEPASALDPSTRRQLIELLIELVQDGQRTIIISSHILQDIEKVIDHVWVLHRGRLIQNKSFDQLLEDFVRLELIGNKGPLPENLPFRSIFKREDHHRHTQLILNRPEMTHEEIKNRLDCQVIQHPLSFEEIYPYLFEAAPLTPA